MMRFGPLATALLLALVLPGCAQSGSRALSEPLSFDQAMALVPPGFGVLVEADGSAGLEGPMPVGVADFWMLQFVNGTHLTYIDVTKGNAYVAAEAPNSFLRPCAHEPGADTTDPTALATKLVASPYWTRLQESAGELLHWRFSCMFEAPHWGLELPPRDGHPGEVLFSRRFAGEGAHIMTPDGLNVQGTSAYLPATATGDANLTVRLVGVTDVAIVATPGMYPNRISGLYSGTLAVTDPTGRTSTLRLHSIGQAGDATFLNASILPDAVTGTWRMKVHVDEPIPGIGVYFDVCTGIPIAYVNPACEVLR